MPPAAAGSGREPPRSSNGASDEPRLTRDPFDGLIVAAALTIGLPLVTRAAAIRESEAVKVVW